MEEGPCQNLTMLVPRFWTSSFQNCEKQISVVEATHSVVLCYSNLSLGGLTELTNTSINKAMIMETYTHCIHITNLTNASFGLCCCDLHSMVLRQKMGFLNRNRPSRGGIHISAKDRGDLK